MSVPIKNIAGLMFNKLLAIKPLSPDKSRVRLWLCSCSCGNLIKVNGSTLRMLRKYSCGCLRKPRKKFFVHGHTINGKVTREYRTWALMKSRCLDKNNKKYKNYGARGIKVCEKWLSFENFLEDMGIKPKNLTLERINVNGNYEPSNCKWATHKEQANNKTNNVYLTYKNKTMNLSQWADFLNISYSVIRTRKHRNYSIEKILEVKNGTLV